ncbi:MAG: MBL fold metallo-hydrolase [Eubacterium sp.]|nr:MBL fold metallo-hydrolase [Eubacterium sp.]
MDISSITVNTHSSIRIDIGKIIYFDPFEIDGSVGDADYIFITHDHYDHYSPEDVKKILKSDTVLVVPQPMRKKVDKNTPVENIIEVIQGQTYETADFTFETVPAYNVLKPFHSKNAGWVGYVLNIDGKRIYVAGDMDATKEAEQVKCDIALIPIGGFYTMNPKDAAGLINKIKPEYAIPTHYGKLVGKPEDGETFKKLVDDDIKVEIKLVF